MIENYDLEKYFRGCYSKDVYDEISEDHFRIINLQNDNDGSGTHWVMYVQFSKNIYYFDSYGVPPYQRLVDQCDRLKYNLYFNKKKLQEDNFSCGYWCLREILKILKS